MRSEFPRGVCGSDEPRMSVAEREARASGYSEAMADQLTGILDQIEEQVKEARAIAATAAEGDPTALDELTSRVTAIADRHAGSRKDESIARDLYDVERSLQAAARRLAALLRRLD